MLVLHALIARFVGDDQFALGVVQSAHQPNGVFDALAGYDPGGLEDEEIIIFQTDRRLEVLAIVIGRRRVLLKFKDVGDECRGDALPKRQLFLGLLINHDVPDVLASMGKGHVEKIGDGVDGKSIALPVEVVVMGDSRNLGFGQELGEGHSKGKMHGDGQDILRDQDLDSKSFHEFVEGRFEVGGQVVDASGDKPAPVSAPPDPLVDPFVFRMGKMGFRNAPGYPRIPIHETGIPETGMPILP